MYMVILNFLSYFEKKKLFKLIRFKIQCCVAIKIPY